MLLTHKSEQNVTWFLFCPYRGVQGSPPKTTQAPRFEDPVNKNIEPLLRLPRPWCSRACKGRVSLHLIHFAPAKNWFNEEMPFYFWGCCWWSGRSTAAPASFRYFRSLRFRPFTPRQFSWFSHRFHNFFSIFPRCQNTACSRFFLFSITPGEIMTCDPDFSFLTWFVFWDLLANLTLSILQPRSLEKGATIQQFGIAQLHSFTDFFLF